MSFPLIHPLIAFTDSSGAALSSGTIEFRDPTSNSLINTYPTADDADAQTNANANPLTLNSRGEAASGIFLEDGVVYKVILKDSAGATIWTIDDVKCPVVSPYAIQTTAESSASVTPSDVSYPEGDIRRYGGTGDGSTDNATALANAIKVADNGGGPVLIPYSASAYNVDSAVTQATLTNPIKIIGVGGQPEIKYAGSAANYVIQITDTNGNDVCLENISINGNSLAATCIRIDNPSANMNDASIGQVRVKDCLFKDGLLKSGQTYSATGISCVGGFSEVILDNLTVRNIDRETGAGTAGSIGCAGALISFDDINAYPKKLTVIGGHIDTITNNETTGNAADVDCDGIIYSVETAANNSNAHVESSMTLWGTKFTDCKGRCVKSQADGFTIIRDFTVVRELEEAINNAIDFDLQRGGGLISGGVYWCNEKSGGGTTWGTSHAIVEWAPDQGATTAPNADGGFKVSDITVYSAIPTATDTLPFFCLLVNDDLTRELSGFHMKDCSVVGGQVDRWVKSRVERLSHERLLCSWWAGR
jgi:hypothetical protein